MIPNKDHVEDLRRCIGSILEKSTWKQVEIIVVENNSREQSIRDYYRELEQVPQVQVVTYEGEFNYSRINNYGVTFAKGEYLLFLNNDTEVITPDWIEQLLMYAQRPDVAPWGRSSTMRTTRSSMRAWSSALGPTVPQGIRTIRCRRSIWAIWGGSATPRT